MNRILDKLRSGRGASITFALLLFLVCAVLSTVIVTTASTAAGRMSNMAEADQRYYSVTSACELLKELIHGKTVSVVKVIDGDNAGTYLVPNMGAEQASINYADVEYKVDDSEAIIKKSIVNEAAYACYKGNAIDQTITISGTGLQDTEPDIKETMDGTGKLTIVVSKVSGINDNPFAIRMIFYLDKKEISEKKTVTDAEGNPKEKTTKTASSYTWYLKSMNVVSATGAGA